MLTDVNNIDNLGELIKDDLIDEELAENDMLDEAKDFMTKRERWLKAKLIELLTKNGHPKYAERLKDFVVNIVKSGEQPATAATSFATGIIYVNEDIIVNPRIDPTIFNQLDVIIRHEMLHNLLMHEVRMIKYLEDSGIPQFHAATSSSLQELLNIIMDFEISNRAYTNADKKVVRATWLAGRLISGLVTEDHRDAWFTTNKSSRYGLTVEEMYEELMKEIHDAGDTGQLSDGRSGNLSMVVARMHSFKNGLDNPCEFSNAKDFENAIMAGVRKENPNAKLPQNYQEIFDGVDKILQDPNVGYDLDDMTDMIKQIAATKALEKCELKSPKTGEILCTIYTPEEKTVAQELLKEPIQYPMDYATWYKEVMKVVGKDPDLTAQDIQDIFDAINK